MGQGVEMGGGHQQVCTERSLQSLVTVCPVSKQFWQDYEVKIMRCSVSLPYVQAHTLYCSLKLVLEH